ncbi:1041_t:CDS:2 [Acaulospora morrowiae]|uniref:Superoxide dismutase n=1 Tax=Acaulospora morrowiae TaxID=94023 RepID=A0A9N9GQ27_9GLOM|nr:1041_t:CDS:2 [Acaulospora morrowiae]
MYRLKAPLRVLKSIVGPTTNSSGPLTRAGSTIFVISRSKHTVPDLPYDYNALEPVISADIMKIHHDKHHQAYVNGLNVAEEKFEQALKDRDVHSQIALQEALKFNGGGHINHSLFWTNLAPTKDGGGEHPKGALLSAIQKDFGSVDDFISKFNTTTVGIQGSGWGWLGYNKSNKRLEIVTLPNQDPLITHVPLLGIDVWEHAYYLQYKNARADYLKAIWAVVNWKTVAERFATAQ